jgi:hypothetical protein
MRPEETRMAITTPCRHADRYGDAQVFEVNDR